MGRLDELDVAPDRVDLRNLVVLLLDISGSMKDGPIDALNAAVDEFLGTTVPRNPHLRRSGEIAVGGFGGDVVEWQSLSPSDPEGSHPFYLARNLRAQAPFLAGGRTPMAKAIVEGLTVINERKKQLRAQGRSHQHRPMLYLMTDGTPTDSLEDMQKAVAALQRMETERRVLFFSIGTRGADMEVLRRLSVGGEANAYDLQSMSFAATLNFVSRSSEHVMSGAAASAGYEAVDADPDNPVNTYRAVNQFMAEWHEHVDQTTDFAR